MNAAPSIDDLLTRVPELGGYTVAPAALSPLPQMRAIERVLRASIESSPEDARGYAMLGNLLTRQSLYLQARDAYTHAIEIDAGFAAAYLAAAELSSIVRDDEAARTYLSRALAIRRRFDDPMPVGDRTPVLMLLKDAPYAVNAPLEVLLDRNRVALHKLYVGEEPRETLPDHAVAFVAFGYAPGDERAVANASKIAALSARTINAPQILDRSSRAHLAATLAGIEGVAVATVQAVDAKDLANIELPAIIRPIDSHAGHGLAHVRTKTELELHVQGFPSRRYAVSSFVDYRSPDGYYRKYRIIVVDGMAFPYHLAVSPRWIVHYQSSPMEEHEWMRLEEERFLADPASVFPQWVSIAQLIARRTKLEYVGLDVARLPDGTMLVFEADPAMLVHDEDETGPFSFKRPYVDAIRQAVHRALT
ncbi:MAG: hypothetical protein JO322_06895 [Candidatus Eremiobacteraeota bacterium]|nr:hypothetical protein [Candidatus Eremiobacteraeota bacterium]